MKTPIEMGEALAKALRLNVHYGDMRTGERCWCFERYEGEAHHPVCLATAAALAEWEEYLPPTEEERMFG